MRCSYSRIHCPKALQGHRLVLGVGACTDLDTDRPCGGYCSGSCDDSETLRVRPSWEEPPDRCWCDEISSMTIAC